MGYVVVELVLRPRRGQDDADDEDVADDDGSGGAVAATSPTPKSADRKSMFAMSAWQWPLA